MTPEGRIKADCLRYLERRGFFVWNNPSGVVRIAPDRWIHFGRKGSSDIIGVLPDGRFLAVEVKAPHGRLSPEQSAFLEKVRGLGGVAIFVRSSSLLNEFPKNKNSEKRGNTNLCIFERGSRRRSGGKDSKCGECRFRK